MLKKGLPMNPDGALSAALLEKRKPDLVTLVTLVMAARNAKCSLQYVQLAEKKLPCLSNQLVTSLYIAGTATNHVLETTGKPLTV